MYSPLQILYWFYPHSRTESINEGEIHSTVGSEVINGMAQEAFLQRSVYCSKYPKSILSSCELFFADRDFSFPFCKKLYLNFRFRGFRGVAKLCGARDSRFLTILNPQTIRKGKLYKGSWISHVQSAGISPGGTGRLVKMNYVDGWGTSIHIIMENLV